MHEGKIKMQYTICILGPIFYIFFSRYGNLICFILFFYIYLVKIILNGRICFIYVWDVLTKRYIWAFFCWIRLRPKKMLNLYGEVSHLSVICGGQYRRFTSPYKSCSREYRNSRFNSSADIYSNSENNW